MAFIIGQNVQSVHAKIKRTIPVSLNLLRFTGMSDSVKRELYGAAIWIICAWFWTYTLLGFVISPGAFHTPEEENIHQAYVNGPNKPAIEEIDKAIQGSIRHTDRIKMMIAIPLALVEFGLYVAVKSRRVKRDELSALPSKTG